MRLFKHSFEIIDQLPGIDGINKQIERAGRTCYKSENKITPDSAKGFVDRMIQNGHNAMLEHGTVYLKFPMLANDNHLYHRAEEYNKNPYSKVRIAFEENGQPIHSDNGYYITTNLRVLIENNWLDDLKYICEPTEYHEKRVTVKFITGIDITREYNRHRVNSPAEQSTRYCNYTKDKFGNELSIMCPPEIGETVIENTFYDWDEKGNQNEAFRAMCNAITYKRDDCFQDIDTWMFAHLATEWSYFRLIKLGWKPQFARRVLCLDTKSELIHTAFVSDWKHFFKLRSNKYGIGGAHPDASLLADELYEEFIKRNYIKDLK